jgi:hypothetical protein
MGAQGFLDDSQAQGCMQIARNCQPKVPPAGGMTKEVMCQAHIGFDQPT